MLDINIEPAVISKGDNYAPIIMIIIAITTNQRYAFWLWGPLLSVLFWSLLILINRVKHQVIKLECRTEVTGQKVTTDTPKKQLHDKTSN